MPFGGFAPLPLRLGGDFTAAQHARLAADLTAAKRVAPLAVIAYSYDSGTGDATITTFFSRAEVGVASSYTPGIVVNGVGDTTVTFDVRWLDEFEEETPIGVRHARAYRNSATGGKAIVNVENTNEVRVRVFDSAGAPEDAPVFLIIQGASDVATAYGTRGDIGQYGGSTDKRDSSTERTPYAWGYYRTLQSARGSAYSQKAGTLVAAENIAIARSEAARTRAAEKFSANMTPAAADEKLEWWVEVLRVPRRPNEPRWRLRLRCAAKYRSLVGPSAQDIDEALQKLLGDAYVKSWRQVGTDLNTPPTQTFWPVNPGVPTYDLGNGTWLSERAHLVVEVQRPPGMTQNDFLHLMNVQLFELLDRSLPAWATFNWGLDVSTGFALDISQLDFGALI